jgi:hypothetical protein
LAFEIKQVLKPGLDMIKKKPILFAGLGAAALGIFVFMRRSALSTAAASQEAAVTSDNSDLQQSILTNVQSLLDQNNQQLMSTVGSTMQEYLNTTDEMITGIQSSNTNVSDQVSSQIAAITSGLAATNQILNTVVQDHEGVKTSADLGAGSGSAPMISPTNTPNTQSVYNEQKSATQQIQTLKDQYMQAQKVYLQDGNISKDEQAQLDTIHNKAEKIGITAGLGAGGEDGSQRKMVY